MSSLTANLFSHFSYYEACSGSHYASMFPSVNTTQFHGKTIGFKIFDEPNFTESDLKVYLQYLISMNFGFKDCLSWLLPPDVSSQNVFNAHELCAHLNTLEIIHIDTDSDVYATLATSASPIFTTPFVIRLTNESSPQKAIDTIPCYVHETKVITTVGYKKKSQTVDVVFQDGDVLHVLNIGIFGYINGAGEHVNARQEGVLINECIAEHRATINNDDIVALYKDVAIANRGLIEEVGLDVAHGAHAKFFIFGISDKIGRDLRYVSHQYVSERSGKTFNFGYDRSSESILIASIIKCSPPDFLPDPSDVEEMEVGKARLVPLEELATEFKIGGKFQPAFPEHANQLAMLVKKMHLMI